MQTATGQDLYPLPDDFGRIVRLAVDDRETCGIWRAIQVVTEEAMARMRAKDEPAVGTPAVAAIICDGAQRWLRFHPSPDAQYNIDAVYEPHYKML